MSVNRVTPAEAVALLDNGWVYLDVRSVSEFGEGHPPGAYNIPLLHQTADGGRIPNPNFMPVSVRTFPKNTQLVVGCRSGRRSLAAAEMLFDNGYASVVDMKGGMVGEVGATGATVCEGWEQRGLDISTVPQSGRSYDDLKDLD